MSKILIYTCDQGTFEKRQTILEEKCAILEKYVSLQLIQVQNPMWTNGKLQIVGAGQQPQFIMQMAVNVYMKYEVKEGEKFDAKSFLSQQITG